MHVDWMLANLASWLLVLTCSWYWYVIVGLCTASWLPAHHGWEFDVHAYHNGHTKHSNSSSRNEITLVYSFSIHAHIASLHGGKNCMSFMVYRALSVRHWGQKKKSFLNENKCMYGWNPQKTNQTKWEWHHNTFCTIVPNMFYVCWVDRRTVSCKCPSNTINVYWWESLSVLWWTLFLEYYNFRAQDFLPELQSTIPRALPGYEANYPCSLYQPKEELNIACSNDMSMYTYS